MKSRLYASRIWIYRRRKLLLLLMAAALLLIFAQLQAEAQDTREITPVSSNAASPERPTGLVVVRGAGSSDPIRRAVEDYRTTGMARTIEQSSVVIYPYGHSQPTLTCAPLRACMVELEAGEVLMAVIAGDTERWILSEAYAGPNGDTPLIVVKPTGWDLTTNLIISTDRRIYELTLDAPPPREHVTAASTNPQQFYTRRISFYYPDEMVRTLQRQEVQAEQVAGATIPVMNPEFTLGNLNFNYEWQGTANFPFDLHQVFDDGAHTYIKLPGQAKHSVAPVLFIEENGRRKILNYTVRVADENAQYYVTDRPIDKAVLVMGVERKNWRGKTKHAEERMHIVNKDRR